MHVFVMSNQHIFILRKYIMQGHYAFCLVYIYALALIGDTFYVSQMIRFDIH